MGIHNQDLSASQNEPFYQSFSSFFGVDEDFNRFIIKRQLIESESGLRLPLPVLFLFYSFHATTALWFLLNSKGGLWNICFISLWVTTHSSLVTVTSRNCLRSLTCKFHIQTILRISWELLIMSIRSKFCLVEGELLCRIRGISQVWHRTNPDYKSVSRSEFRVNTFGAFPGPAHSLVGDKLFALRIKPTSRTDG